MRTSAVVADDVQLHVLRGEIDTTSKNICIRFSDSMPVWQETQKMAQCCDTDPWLRKSRRHEVKTLYFWTLAATFICFNGDICGTPRGVSIASISQQSHSVFRTTSGLGTFDLSVSSLCPLLKMHSREFCSMSLNALKKI